VRGEIESVVEPGDSPPPGSRLRPIPIELFFFLDLDAEGLQELEVLVVDLEFRIGRESGDQRCLVGGFFALLAHPNGGFKNEKNIVTTLLDARDDFGDLFRVGERFVDSFAEFLHQIFELLIHVIPQSPSIRTANH